MKKPVFESKKKSLYYHDEKVDMLKIVNYFNYLLSKSKIENFKSIDISTSKDSEYYTLDIRFFDENSSNVGVSVMDFYSSEKVNNLISFIEDIFKGKYKTLESIKTENKRINGH